MPGAFVFLSILLLGLLSGKKHVNIKYELKTIICSGIIALSIGYIFFSALFINYLLPLINF
jgi:hypothetical protein